MNMDIPLTFESLPIGSPCSICLDTMSLNVAVNYGDVPMPDFGGANIMVTFCGHTFHSYCITRWLKCFENRIHGTCPNCRTKIHYKICVPIHPSIFSVGSTFPVPLEEWVKSINLQLEVAFKRTANDVLDLHLDDLKKQLKEHEAELRALILATESAQNTINEDGPAHGL